MFGLIATAVAASISHPCNGDFVYRAADPDNEVSIGVRVRNNPDFVEVQFSDYGNLQLSNITWKSDSVVAAESNGKGGVVMVCNQAQATLVLPADEYQSARTFPLRKVKGSLWDVGLAEGWLKPESE